MAFGGFGKNSGPSLPPKTQTAFGNFPRSPSPPIPFNNNAPQRRSPSGSEAPQIVRSPPLDYGRKSSIDDLSYPFVEAWRPTVSPPSWADLPKQLINDSNFQTHQRPSVAPYIASRNTGTRSPVKPANFQGLKRTRSPPSANEVLLENSTEDVVGRSPVSSQRMHSPPLAFESYHSIEDLYDPFEGAQSGFLDGGVRLPTKISNFQAPKRTRPPSIASTNEVLWRNSNSPQDDTDRPAVSLGNRPNMLANNANSQPQQSSSPFSPNIDAEVARTKSINSQVPNRTRSPPLPSTDEIFPENSYSTQDDDEREMQAKAKRLARFNVELSQPVQSDHDLTKHKFSGNRHDQALVERRKFVVEHPIEATGDVMLSDYEGLESSSVIIGLCPDMCPELEREERERKGDLDKYERLDGDRNQTSKALAVKKYNRTAEREADLIRPIAVLQKTVDYLLALLDQPYDDRFLGMYNFLWDRMRAIRMDLRMQHIFNQDAITMLEQMIRLHIIAMHELCEYTKGEGFSEGFDAHLNIEQMNKTSVELFEMYDDHRKKGSSVLSEKEFRGYYALLKLDKHPGYKVEPAELSLDLAKMTSETRQTPEILFSREVARACRTGNFIAFFRLARKATYLQACLMHAHFAKLRTQALASLHSGLQNNQGIPVAHVTKWIGMEEEDIESLLEYHGFLIKEFEESYMVKEGPFLNSDKDYPTKCAQLVHMKKSRTIIEDISSTDQVVWPTQEAKKVVKKMDKVGPESIRFVKTKTSVNAGDDEMIDFQDSTPVDDSQIQPILEIPSAAGQRFGNGRQETNLCFVPWGAPSIHNPPQSTPAKVGKVGKPASKTLRSDSLERNLRSNMKGMPMQTVTGRALQIERSDGSYFESLVENSASKRVLIKTKTQENDEARMACQETKNEEATFIHQEIENEEDMMVRQENEAATAQLKLILRIWKRRSSKRRELREQRQLAANVALSSLSLGPPIRQITAQPSHVSELNIDRVVRERREMHGRSWSRLNVSEVVGNILSERNANAKCLCWKLLVCSPMNGMGEGLRQGSHTNHWAGQWLLSKLMGVRMENDDDLAVSSPGLSIWRKWVTRPNDSLPTCCLSVIRETELNKLDDSVGGASAFLFLISESIPWELQKTQLHNLLMSLPSGSHLPLLILSGTYKKEILDPSSTIVNGLALHHMDKTRISSFSIVFLVENQPPENLDGFFSNDRLREGLRWLASQSPLQPILHCVKTRELVMDHLNSSLEMLDKMNVNVIDPNHCISAFNKALDQSAEEVATAADANPASWPCPEIDQLEEFSNESRAMESFLPNLGWSSAVRIKLILNAIQGCKLPFFVDDLSWLNHGSDMGKDIKNQKSQLEKCLIRYLAHSTKIMDWALATMETHAMLQKSARLELQGSEYHILPRWVAIFRRVFNWRLMNLTSGIHSTAYVLEHRSESCMDPCDIVTPSKFGVREFTTDATSPTLEGLDTLWLEGSRSLSYALTQPSLDEMVEICCSSHLSGMEQSEPEAIQHQSGTVDKGYKVLDAATSSDNYDENLRQEDGEFTETSHAFLPGNYRSSNQLVVTTEGKKEADRLSKLLEQCNILQDMIDEKLSIYF